jgi:hypothetical protein
VPILAYCPFSGVKRTLQVGQYGEKQGPLSAEIGHTVACLKQQPGSKTPRLRGDLTSFGMAQQTRIVELNGRQVSTFRSYVRNTAVGIELDAPAGTDRRLLAIARATETIILPLSAPRLRSKV